MFQIQIGLICWVVLSGATCFAGPCSSGETNSPSVELPRSGSNTGSVVTVLLSVTHLWEVVTNRVVIEEILLVGAGEREPVPVGRQRTESLTINSRTFEGFRPYCAQDVAGPRASIPMHLPPVLLAVDTNHSHRVRLSTGAQRSKPR